MRYILSVCLNPSYQKIISLPRLVHDDVNRARDLRAMASGKGVNAARTLHLLGVRAAVAGLAGGNTGALVRAGLRRERIPAYFARTRAETRTCVTILEREPRTTTELIEPTGTIAPAEVEDFWRHYRKLAAWSRMALLLGTVPRGVPDGIYARLIREARAVGVPTFLDGSGAPWRRGAAARPDVLKCNLAEFQEAVGEALETPRELVTRARRFLTGETRWVVVTAGKSPALFLNRRAAYWAVPPAVDAVNTVGSGDAMNGGFAQAFLEGWPDRKAIAWAVACGTANVLVSGPGLVRPRDVKRLSGHVTIFAELARN